jgi:hypothetical protein
VTSCVAFSRGRSFHTGMLYSILRPWPPVRCLPPLVVLLAPEALVFTEQLSPPNPNPPL